MILRFDYECPDCGHHTGSTDPNLESCPIPVYGDGEPVIIPPRGKTYADFGQCGGDLGEGGPTVQWWMIPEDLQTEIMRRLATPENVETPT